MSDLIKRINKGPSVGDLEIALEAKDAEIAHLEQALDEIINMDSCLLADAKAIAMGVRNRTVDE